MKDGLCSQLSPAIAPRVSRDHRAASILGPKWTEASIEFPSVCYPKTFLTLYRSSQIAGESFSRDRFTKCLLLKEGFGRILK